MGGLYRSLPNKRLTVTVEAMGCAGHTEADLCRALFAVGFVPEVASDGTPNQHRTGFVITGVTPVDRPARP